MNRIIIAFRFALLTMILGGLIYPLTITGMAQALFPAQANGSLLKNAQGTIVGSVLIGQEFIQPGYFHPRPSANHYDSANSGGSNFGVSSQKLNDRVKQDAAVYQKANSQNTIAIDAVTASASGLDPHISLANAMAQAPRVAATRHLDLKTVEQLVRTRSENKMTEARYINVLLLNQALNALTEKL